MHSDPDDDDRDYQLARSEPQGKRRPDDAPLPPVPHQPLRPGEKIFAARTVAPLARKPERRQVRRSTWQAAIREEFAAVGFGSVTAVFGLLALALAAGMILWGLSDLATAARKPVEVVGLCTDAKVLAVHDKETGKYQPVPGDIPLTYVEFQYDGRQYTTNRCHVAFVGLFYERGHQAPVWVFSGTPSRAVIAPGPWESFQGHHIAYMRTWGLRWIAAGVVSLAIGAVLSAVALLRLNAVRRGERNPYALSLRLE